MKRYIWLSLPCDANHAAIQIGAILDPYIHLTHKRGWGVGEDLRGPNVTLVLRSNVAEWAKCCIESDLGAVAGLSSGAPTNYPLTHYHVRHTTFLLNNITRSSQICIKWYKSHVRTFYWRNMQHLCRNTFCKQDCTHNYGTVAELTAAARSAAFTFWACCILPRPTVFVGVLVGVGFVGVG